MINKHLFIFIASLVNYLGLVSIALIDEGTIFSENYIGTYYVTMGIPFFFPLTYLVIYLTLTSVNYLFKLNLGNQFALKYSIIFWSISLVLGLVSAPISMLVFMIFAPLGILIDML